MIKWLKRRFKKNKLYECVLIRDDQTRYGVLYLSQFHPRLRTSFPDRDNGEIRKWQVDWDRTRLSAPHTIYYKERSHDATEPTPGG